MAIQEKLKIVGSGLTPIMQLLKYRCLFFGNECCGAGVIVFH
jgi:hypothetical protein